MADKNDIVIINLDRPRELRFGHKALKTLSALTGKSLDNLLDSHEGIGIEELEKVMYCGLLSDAKDNNEILKLEDMEDLLDQAPFGEIVASIEKAFEAAFGTLGEKQLKNGQRIAKQK